MKKCGEAYPMNKAIVLMFSGQGSQYYQMGKELFDRHPVFQKWMRNMDDMVRQYIGVSIINQVYDFRKRKAESFDRTLYSHPAIFMVEYALAQVLLESGIRPDYVLGASLGEFAASAVSGSIKAEDALECLLKQAEVFEMYCQNSSMLAVIYDYGLYYENQLLSENSELAAVNYDRHFVISGKTEKIEAIIGLLKSKDIAFQLLPVSFGFHSSCIDAGEKVYREFLTTKSFYPPRTALISCLSGTQLNEVPANFFWDVVRKPVRFPQAIREIETRTECIYLDLGPAGTLTNFAKRNLAKDSNSQCYSILNPFHQDLKNIAAIEELFHKRIL
jgi:trans-AT polyketide synthase/acyltransferase/oxidoreductase domain-containing protein